MTTVVLILIVVLSYLVYFFFNYKKSKLPGQSIANLKTKWLHLIIPSLDFEIRTRKTEIVDEKNSSFTISMIDDLWDLNDSKLKESIEISMMLYEGTFRNKLVRFVSEPIYIGKEVLQNYLISEQKISIYVNPENFDDYIFELKNLP